MVVQRKREEEEAVEFKNGNNKQDKRQIHFQNRNRR